MRTIDYEFTYTREDFYTTKPYEELVCIEDPFQQTIAEKRLAEYAKKVEFSGFKETLRQYKASLKNAAQSSIYVIERLSKFDEQVLELDTGDWIADDAGIWKYGGLGGAIEVACSHPIMPIERLKNINTGELKVRLAFRRGNKDKQLWKEILTDFDIVSNAKNIVSLSRIGISVTSGKRAQNLVDYLTDVMDKNYDFIPERKSVSKMGWNQEGFSPYVDGIVFDGNENFERTYFAINPHGSYEKWLEEAKSAREYSLGAKIVMAAAFGSVLVEPLGCLPFFVHLWGMDSGTGKTVAQMLAASVWANPTPGGDYFKTFKSTSVGFEVMAGFLNSLPVIIDELQLAKDHRGKLIFNVYELASGSGKLRSNKKLGLVLAPTWLNCFITSGETPLVSESDGAGALNRVVEIECKADAKVIQDGHRTAGVVKENYGHAGKAFVEHLSNPENIEWIKSMYEAAYISCMGNNTTEKQAMAAAIILTADAAASRWIFNDGNILTVSEIAEFLKSKESVSAADRGYNYMCDWVSQNQNKLQGSAEFGEVYGVIEDNYAYINRSVFNKACTEYGINAPALLSHLKSRGLILTRSDGRGNTKTRRIGGVPMECVVMRLPEDDGIEK